jgi:predicted CoA-binding protein
MRPSSIPESVSERLRDKSAGTRIAVVGASNDPDKYGNIIVRNLDRQGYAVLPVNPKGGEVAGLTAWPDLASVPRPIDIVDMVTPPSVTRKVLEALDPLSVGAVWLQDGSFDDEVIRLAESRFPVVVHHACIMVVTRTL